MHTTATEAGDRPAPGPVLGRRRRGRREAS